MGYTPDPAKLGLVRLLLRFRTIVESLEFASWNEEANSNEEATEAFGFLQSMDGNIGDAFVLAGDIPRDFPLLRQIWRQLHFASDAFMEAALHAEFEFLNGAFSEVIRIAENTAERMRTVCMTGLREVSSELATELKMMESVGITSQETLIDQQSLGSYLPKELAYELDISTKKLSEYAKVTTGVETPGVGKRNHRYSEADYEAICRTIVAIGGDAGTVSLARSIIEKIERNRTKTENKPKDRN